MKKLTRITLRICICLALLTTVACVLFLDGVDNRPYFHESYYTDTIARLHATVATNTVARGELAAGFGRARLTPELNAPQDDPANGRFRSLPLAGFGNRHGRPATGAHDDLYVKAVAIRVGARLGVMVGADALIIPPEVTRMVAARLKSELALTRDQIYLSATHSHSSIGGWGEGVLNEEAAGKFQPGVRIWFADRIVTAIRDAVADLKPAAYGRGSFDAPGFVQNRLVGALGKVDPEFSFAVLKQQSGRTAVIGSYSAHATILSAGNMEFSADYPGYWQRAVEEATGGIAVFIAGGVGSHSPNAGPGGFKAAERMGQSLAKALLAELPQTTLTNSIAFDMLGLDVTLPPLNARLTDGIRLRPWIAARLLPAAKDTFIQALRLDDSIWISTPCDFSGELALNIKDFLRIRGSHATLTSFNGDYIGYVIPSRYYHLDGYEPRTMSFFGPEVPDYFDELIRTIAAEMAGK